MKNPSSGAGVKCLVDAPQPVPAPEGESLKLTAEVNHIGQVKIPGRLGYSLKGRFPESPTGGCRARILYGQGHQALRRY